MKYIFIVLFVLMLGCSESTSYVPTALPDPDYDFTGTWDGSLTGATTATIFVMTGTQTGNDIDGTLISDAGFTFSVSGQAWENNITLVCVDVDNPLYVLTCSGVSDGDYAFGLWSDNMGQNGDWEALIR